MSSPLGAQCDLPEPDNGDLVCYCNCYFASNCPGSDQCPFGLYDVCLWRDPSLKPTFCPDANDPGATYGGCDGVCVSPDAGSDCGDENPASLSRVLQAWTRAYDTTAVGGGGPVGPASLAAYNLGHRTIVSAECRRILARTAFDLQEVCRSSSFLIHPEDHAHQEADHAVRDLSNDPCAYHAGRLCGDALSAAVNGRPDRARDFLAQIPRFCPEGQSLGGRCEGTRDEIACLAVEIDAKARFLTTPHPTRGFCGDGILQPEEECEDGVPGASCGFTGSCLSCNCFEMGCL